MRRRRGLHERVAASAPARVQATRSRHRRAGATLRGPNWPVPRARWAPSPSDAADAGMLSATAGFAMLGFSSTFSGWGFLLVGVLGVALGIAATHAANVRGLPVIVAAAGGVVAYFLLGGPVAAGRSVLPTPATLDVLSDALVHGWRDLLTTVPPVNGSGDPLLLPYVLGLAVGVAGFALATRTRAPAWPLLVVLGLLAAVILLGSLEPASVVPGATGFALLALFWASVRHARLRPVLAGGSGRGARAAIAGALLLGCGFGAVLVGSHLPGSDAHERVAMRRYITPPMDIGSYPSPLASYRHYVGGQADAEGNPTSLAEQVLFEVTGSVPAGTSIRFATLDAYDGVVWGAAEGVRDERGVQNAFLKVGSTLDNPARGATYTMSVEIQSYADYWMPVAGSVQGIRFDGGSAARQTTDFRYNLSTQSGIVPGMLRTGDSYTLQVSGVAAAVLADHDALAASGYSRAGAFLETTATALAGDAVRPAAAVLRIGEQLRTAGRYTHGDPGGDFAYYLPGHSVGRLTSFVNGVARGFPAFVGDDEQYAAAYALMIGQLGVPARVIVGIPSLPAGGVVRGSDVRAWVEVQSVTGQWLQIPSETFISAEPPDENLIDETRQDDLGSTVPPPAQGLPKTVAEDVAASDGASNDGRDRLRLATWHAPGWLRKVGVYGGLPAAIVLVGLLGIVAAKSWRRQLRRARGTPAARLARGWQEIVDHARDLGMPLIAQGTRREQARNAEGVDLLPLAALADAYVFGGGDVTPEHARSFWLEVDAVRKKMSADAGRPRRFAAAVSPATFFRPVATGEERA